MTEIIAFSFAISIIALVSGFSFCFWLVIKHLKHQEILAKSQTVGEYTEREVAITNTQPTEEIKEEVEDTGEKDITEVSAEEAFKPR